MKTGWGPAVATVAAQASWPQPCHKATCGHCATRRIPRWWGWPRLALPRSTRRQRVPLGLQGRQNHHIGQSGCWRDCGCGTGVCSHGVCAGHASARHIAAAHHRMPHPSGGGPHSAWCTGLPRQWTPTWASRHRRPLDSASAPPMQLGPRRAPPHRLPGSAAPPRCCRRCCRADMMVRTEQRSALRAHRLIRPGALHQPARWPGKGATSRSARDKTMRGYAKSMFML
jgi:hypothetical protein